MNLNGFEWISSLERGLERCAGGSGGLTIQAPSQWVSAEVEEQPQGPRALSPLGQGARSWQSGQHMLPGIMQCYSVDAWMLG